MRSKRILRILLAQPVAGRSFMPPGISPRGWRAQPGKLALIFDGACSRCRSSMQVLMGFTGGERIEAIEDRAVAERFPGLTREEMLREAPRRR